jgi:hypothetical protein
MKCRDGVGKRRLGRGVRVVLYEQRVRKKEEREEKEEKSSKQEDGG